MFAREGASVVLGARSEDRLAELRGSFAELCGELRAAGSDASYVRCDVSSASDTKRLVDAAVTRHGRIDGAFNNAGMGQGGGALADMTEEAFDRVLAVNLKGVWLAMRAEIRAMLAAGTSGAIVNTSSVGASAAGKVSVDTTPRSTGSSA